MTLKFRYHLYTFSWQLVSPFCIKIKYINFKGAKCLNFIPLASLIIRQQLVLVRVCLPHKSYKKLMSQKNTDTARRAH